MSPGSRCVSGSPGEGSATVRFAVAANNTGVQRTGPLTIAGLPFQVTQSGTGCAPSINPTGDATVPAQGKKATFQYTSCGAWTASSSNPSWLQVYPLSGTASQAVEYNVFPNFRTVPRTGTIIINGVPFVVTQLAATRTNNERFVQFVYFNFLGRFPSAAELAAQLPVLEKTSRAEFILSFFNTPEFNLGGRFIAGLYVGILDRDAEHSGWLFQRDALANGVVPQAQLVSNFIDSAEYKLKFPVTTAEAFVRQLYRYVLLREATPGEVTFHVGTSLTPNTPTARIELARRFLNTTEFRTGTGPRLTAFLLRATLLQRDPTAQERSELITKIGAGVTILDLIQEIIATPEFMNLLN